MNKTYIQKVSEVNRCWYLLDARDKILGRFATNVAKLLRGKDKPTFTPNIDAGDYVIVINARDIRVTGKKMENKVYKRFSGYPSGLKEINLESLLNKCPEEVIRLAVRRMLPNNRLSQKMFKRLKVYSKHTHPHQAQKVIVKKA